MIRRWLLYWAALAGSVGFFLAYRYWLGWVTLLAVLCLPVLSLVLSLPGMLTLRLELPLPRRRTLGSGEPVACTQSCRAVAPPCRYGLRAVNMLTGERLSLEEGTPLPSHACGKLVCRTEKGRVYDYLGLLALPLPAAQGRVYLYPDPLPMEQAPELEQEVPTALRPKPGGGFGEHHELRLYRPGDGLNQVHWKLTAKTGKLMVREAMVPVSRLLRLDILLSGTQVELNRKLGRLLWLGGVLLEKERPFQIRAGTARGVLRFRVACEEDLHKALERLLSTPAGAELPPLPPEPAAWQFYIGGPEYEA